MFRPSLDCGGFFCIFTTRSIGNFKKYLSEISLRKVILCTFCDGIFTFIKTMEEIWKDIPGYEGLYQVSSLGNVKGVKRTIYTIRGIRRDYQEKDMKQFICKRGYHRVDLCKEGSTEYFHVHQLVAMAFLNHKRDNGLTVNHKNFNKSCNIPNNLEIVTKEYNSSYQKRKNSSSYMGVSKHWKKWKATISINGTSVNLGLYNSEIEAAAVYNGARILKKALIPILDD